jgi:hypothetical protein
MQKLVWQHSVENNALAATSLPLKRSAGTRPIGSFDITRMQVFLSFFQAQLGRQRAYDKP